MPACKAYPQNDNALIANAVPPIPYHEVSNVEL